MNFKRVKAFSITGEHYWFNLVLFTLFCFYAAYFTLLVWLGNFPFQYGEDFLAYWSAGKLADEKGYSEIYDLTALKTVQTTALNEAGLPITVNDTSIPTMPAPILSIFVVPFQLLSKVDPETGYWIWTVITLAVLVGYLTFFLKKTLPNDSSLKPGNKVLILTMLFYPVFNNLTQGQINIFLLVFTGEFIRASLNKKPFIAGLYLGGLLLKPQLLILIIPIILVLRYWKLLLGFVASSGIVIFPSIFLSGPEGMRGLIGLWTEYSGLALPNKPENMVNWRMIGHSFNLIFDSNAGWMITAAGIVLTIAAVIYLVKSMPEFGSARWVFLLLGVFAATLVTTWHTHYAMVLVLIPFLAYAGINNLLSVRTISKWVIATALVWMVTVIIGALDIFPPNLPVNDYSSMVIGFSGFILNLAILYAVTRSSSNFNHTSVNSRGSISE